MFTSKILSCNTRVILNSFFGLLQGLSSPITFCFELVYRLRGHLTSSLASYVDSLM